MSNARDPETWMAKAVRVCSTALKALESGDPESACNRAYYAMFYGAHAALLKVQAPVSGIKTHSGMISAFSQYIVKPGLLPVEHSRAFSQAHTKRVLADYTGDLVETADAKEVLENAEAFLDAIRDKFMKPEGRPAP